MRTLGLALLALAVAGPLSAQRRLRVGPVVSSIGIESGSGSNSYTSFGGSLALITSDDGEMALAVSRYGDLSSNSCTRQLTFFGVESNYYPIGPSGIAPFASTAVGLARVTDQDVGLLGICSGAQPSNELGVGFGLGVRVNIGTQAAALVEGRFFQVPNSAIQALEGRANVSFTFGKPRASSLLNGTLGPAVGFLMPLGGAFEGRAPTLGVRFLRQTKKSRWLGLQVDYAPLRVTKGCSSDCEPYAILFAPSVEPSAHPAWGRLYGEFGFVIAGFPKVGGDRGIAQGAHGGLGADIVTSGALMWNVNARVLWLQRNDQNNRNAFLLQAGVSLSPRLVPSRGIESR